MTRPVAFLKSCLRDNSIQEVNCAKLRPELLLPQTKALPARRQRHRLPFSGSERQGRMPPCPRSTMLLREGDGPGYSPQVLVHTRSLAPFSPGALGVRAQGRPWGLTPVFTDHMWAAVQQATLTAHPWQSRPAPQCPSQLLCQILRICHFIFPRGSTACEREGHL